MPDYDIEELADHVEENTDNRTSGQTNLKADAPLVEEVKSELGVNMNSQITPLVESLLASFVGKEDSADERLDAFRNQFTDE